MGQVSNGFVFCLGMLNGAFAVSTPDVVSHMAEEVPKYVSRILDAPALLILLYRPSKNIP